MDALRAAVEQHQDVLTVTMLDLREAVQAGRLGQHVLTTISKALAGRGFVHGQMDRARAFGRFGYGQFGRCAGAWP